MQKRLSGVLSALAVLVVTGAAPAAWAQQQRFDIQPWRPTPGPRDLIIVPQSQPLSHLSGSLGAYFSFALDPLVLLDSDGKRALDVVKNRFELHLMGAMGLGGWFELGAVLPVIVFQQSGNLEPTGTEGNIAPTVLGDLSLIGKVPFLRRLSYAKGFGVSLLTRVNFPTGNKEAFASDGAVTFNPTLVADYRFGFGALIAVQAGVYLRPFYQAEFFGVQVGPTFTGNAGLEIPLVRRYGLTALGGVYFNVPLTQLPTSILQVPAETMVALRHYSSIGVTFTFGLNFGLDCGFSVPAFRAFIAAVWVPAKTREYEAIERFKKPPEDPDGDGLIGEADHCPNEKGPVENHGCPVRDYDKDGIPDQFDDCPDLPGTRAYNGCPRVYHAKKENKVKVLEPVQFAWDQDIILPESFDLLSEVATLIVAHKEWQEILIEGHTDSDGSDAYNLDLSQRRANSVVRFLLAHGVEASRLQAQGFGRSRPIADNATLEGRALNRRVEFTILKVAPGSSPPAAPGGGAAPAKPGGTN